MLSPFEIGRKRQNTRCPSKISLAVPNLCGRFHLNSIVRSPGGILRPGRCLMNNSLTLGGMLVVAAICYFAASSRSAGSALAMAAPAPVRMRSVAIRASALNRDCRGAFADEEKKVEEAAPTPTVVIPPELLIDPSEVQEIYEAKKNPTTGKMKQKLMTKPGTVTVRPGNLSFFNPIIWLAKYFDALKLVNMKYMGHDATGGVLLVGKARYSPSRISFLTVTALVDLVDNNHEQGSVS
eukprot:1336954-Amorphochlora_amoeboformis.AAC.1